MARQAPTRPSQSDPWRERMLAVARTRDAAAFAEIFDHFAPRLETYLRRLGLSPVEAEDLAQDVMSVIWVKAALFDPAKSSLATWIYRIARNRRIDRARRTRDNVSLEDLGPALEPVDENRPDQLVAQEQHASALHGALVDLPEEQRRLVHLSYFEGLSQSEIATRAALPLGTVKSRLRLAFNRLRLSLSARGVTDAG